MASLARARTRRPRRDHPRSRATFLRGALVVLVLGLLGFQLLRLYNGVPLRHYGTVFVSTPTVGNLLTHDAVRVAGKRVGQVLAIDVGGDGQPRVKLQLDPGTKLPADTAVQIRANGLLGARYVQLDPGRSRTLMADGAVIHGNERSYSYGLPEAIDVFDAKTRVGLRSTIGGLGAGMLANGEGLNTLIKIGAVQTGNFREIMDAILARDGAADRLLPATDAAFVAFARNTPAIRPWTQAAGDALEPFIRQGAAVRATLDQAPPALRAADEGLGRGNRLLRAVRSLATASAGTLPQLPAGMHALSLLLRDGGPPISRLYPKFIGQARAGINSPHDLVPSLEALRPRVDQLIPNLRPLLDELAAHPCDFKNGTAALRSMTGFEQSSSGAELGPAMAFRLQAVVPGADGVGIGGTGALVKRADHPKDCTYPSTPYPQFQSGGGFAELRNRP